MEDHLPSPILEFPDRTAKTLRSCICGINLAGYSISSQDDVWSQYPGSEITDREMPGRLPEQTLNHLLLVGNATARAEFHELVGE